MWKTHVTPPWASSPPGEAEPDTGRLHVAHGTLNGSNAGRVGSSAHLAEETFEVVLLEPVSRGSETLGADGGGDAGAGGTRAVGVKVLMHFLK